jgi:hypothetical protein
MDRYRYAYCKNIEHNIHHKKIWERKQNKKIGFLGIINNINNLLTDEMQADKKPITMRDGDIVNKFKY